MSIDWEEAHRHLADLGAALERGWSLDAAETQRILTARARDLARIPDAVDTAETQITFLEFTLGREQFGIAAEHVAEVAVAPVSTKVPGTPDFVSGLVNLRGQLLSVIDLGKFFGLAEQSAARLSRVIVLEAREMRVGVLASAIIGVRSMAVDRLQAPIAALTGAHGRYVIGVTPDPTVILDGGKLLASPDILVGNGVDS